GSLRDRPVALLGAAYRGNSEDTRNSPTLYFARLLRERGIPFTIHDPYVYPEDQNLRRFALGDHFTRELPIALEGAELVAFCTPHRVYAEGWEAIRRQGRKLAAVLDACHLLPDSTGFDGLKHAGIGRGRQKPSSALVDAVFAGFQAVEIGVANEVQALVQFLNSRYADTEFNRVRFEEVQRIAGTCPTGCAIANPAGVPSVPVVDGFESRLVAVAGRDPVAIG
ncbi:MAG TPA: UDP-glucose/GDP-mannose dehydrogenase family protein, partial [Gemmatimonadales bacterium]|nr:UDP-glucose/GDP-mannose dehydrogenase family protein [Gemmatimonadales bacterium]